MERPTGGHIADPKRRTLVNAQGNVVDQGTVDGSFAVSCSGTGDQVLELTASGATGASSCSALFGSADPRALDTHDPVGFGHGDWR